MNTIQSRLVSFFMWLMKQSLRSEYAKEMTGGHACNGLSEDLVLCGIQSFVERVSEGDGTEYRLNGAGLKLYIRTNKASNKVRVAIGGDQASYYPTFVDAVEHEIERRNLNY